MSTCDSSYEEDDENDYDVEDLSQSASQEEDAGVLSNDDMSLTAVEPESISCSSVDKDGDDDENDDLYQFEIFTPKVLPDGSREGEDTMPKVKLAVLGESNVGKTTLIRKFVFGIFDKNRNSTIRCDYNEIYMKIKRKNPDKIEDVENPEEEDDDEKGWKTVKVILSDTAGQEVYRATTTNALRGTNGALIVFDPRDKKSFEALDYWRTTLEKVAEECVVGIVATKSDLYLERTPDGKRKYEQWMKIDNMNAVAAEMHCTNGFSRCSALTSPKTHIYSIFLRLVDEAIENKAAKDREYALKSTTSSSSSSSSSSSVVVPTANDPKSGVIKLRALPKPTEKSKPLKKSFC